MAEIQKTEKAKVAIVNSLGEILVLTRSKYEDTRQGESDWPGGTLEGKESAIDGLIRDAGEELPGTTLDNIRPLHAAGKVVSGKFVMSYLFAATAEFPDSGIELSYEHSAFAWVPQDQFPRLDIPKKYKVGVALGSSILDELADLSGPIIDHPRPAINFQSAA